MAMYQWLTRMGKEVYVVHPDPYPGFLSWVKDIQIIINYEAEPEQCKALLKETDLILSLDYNHPSRIGELQPFFEESKAFKIMIDHHQNPSDMADLMYSQPESCSTAQMVFELIESHTPEMIDKNTGTPIYLGIMTDTGSFRFSSVESRTHEILGKLLSAGVAHTHVHEQVYDQVTLSQLQLKAFAINQKLELLEDAKVALISLTKSELERYDYQKGDTEGLVNNALAIKGVKMAMFVREDDEKIKISFRSKHNVHVNEFAGRYFEGGGHQYAAGGVSFESMTDTLEKIKKHVGEYV